MMVGKFLNLDDDAFDSGSVLTKAERASGSLATSVSFTTLPCSLTTQAAVFATDTSSPTNNFIPYSSFWI